MHLSGEFLRGRKITYMMYKEHIFLPIRGVISKWFREKNRKILLFTVYFYTFRIKIC